MATSKKTLKINSHNLNEPGAVAAARLFFRDRGFNRASLMSFCETSAEAGIAVYFNKKTATLTLAWA
jgi:hypothetical protein